MSGPKDFSIVLSLARQAELAARHAHRMRLMQREIQQRMEANRKRIKQEIDLLKARSGIANTSKKLLVKDDMSNLKKAEIFQKSSTFLVGSQGELKDALSSNPIDHAAADCPRVETDQLAEKLLSLKHELSDNKTVSDFQGLQSQAWFVKTTEILKSDTVSDGDWENLARIQVAEAERILGEAFELEQKFEVRNEILIDVMDSLKEVGFIVNDPQFEDPSKPGKPVYIRATRGIEKFEAKVDLEQNIKSIWNQVEAEHCRDSFSKFADSLHSKGVDVKADFDFKTKPESAIARKKDLPRNRDSGN